MVGAASLFFSSVDVRAKDMLAPHDRISGHRTLSWTPPPSGTSSSTCAGLPRTFCRTTPTCAGTRTTCRASPCYLWPCGCARCPISHAVAILRPQLRSRRTRQARHGTAGKRGCRVARERPCSPESAETKPGSVFDTQPAVQLQHPHPQASTLKRELCIVPCSVWWVSQLHHSDAQRACQNANGDEFAEHSSAEIECIGGLSSSSQQGASQRFSSVCKFFTANRCQPPPPSL